MPRILHAHLLPSLMSPHCAVGHTVVVIDVLRATTTMVYALGAGAREVIPCVEVSEARQLAAQSNGRVLLGGERRGLPIDGFDLGNSPAEYTGHTVSGRRIVMTTTNGTRAIARCEGAARIYMGAFANLSAICRALRNEPQVDLLCAGTRGEITREDTLLAGAILDGLPPADTKDSPAARLNDQAIIARDAWRSAGCDLTSGKRLAATLRDTQGGRNLLAIGQDRDIELAAQIDRFDILPELDRDTGAIRVP